MKLGSYLFVVLLAATILSPSSAYMSFPEYTVAFNKSYTAQEYAFRWGVYNSTIANFPNIVNFVPGVNNFTDWTQDEIKGLSQLRLLPQSSRVSSPPLSAPRLGAPASVDHRSSGIITSVKNQGSCGACWAFTAAALTESYLVSNGSQSASIDLSEQFLVQCTSRSTCAGGYIQNGLDKINSKAPTQSQYSYISPSSYGGGICQSGGVDTKTKRSSYYSITDSELISLLQYRPVAVAVASSGWSSYTSGTLSCSSSASVDHAVVAVGYTATHIIIKNSWGTSWGINGYATISRTAGSNCKITDQAHVILNWGSGLQLALFFVLMVMIVML